MDYQPRTIALLSELVHPPLAPDPRPIQKLHARLFEPGPPAYASFAVTPAGPVLSNPPARPGAVSQVAFLADRVHVREELSPHTPESFAERLRTIVEAAAPLRGVQLFTAHQVTLRSLVNPRHWRDSRAFLRDGVCDIGAQIEAFGRAPAMYGLRLLFPPAEGAPDAYAVRIESYNADPRSLYVEVSGTFGAVVVERGLAALEENVLTTYRFLLERALSFVARFDARQPS